MNRSQLPTPPDPGAMPFVEWQRAVYQWMLKVKQQVEADSLVNTRPCGQFLVSTYTGVTTMTGTDALSNVVATLISDLQGGGYLTTPRTLR